jgi:hypothetical protein
MRVIEMARIYDFSRVQGKHLLWRGKRFCLVDIRSEKQSDEDFDLIFFDGLFGGEVAFIRQNKNFEFDCYLTAPNTDMFVLGSVAEICSEIPKIVNAYLRSKK